MCLSPYVIPNPNYHSKNPYIYAYKDTWSRFINIPCGVCPQCIAARQLELVQRVQMESLVSHIFFSTLTYRDYYLPWYVTSSGRCISYADFHDIDLLCKRIRNGNLFGRPFRYYAVFERGGKKHRPHFHILWFIEKRNGDDFNSCLSLEALLKDVILKCWSRNVGSKRKPIYVPITDYHARFCGGKLFSNYDTHYVNPSLSTNGIADCAFYVMKYLLKVNPYERYLYNYLKSCVPPGEFYKAWKIVRSHSTSSKSFGLPHNPKVISYLRSCIERSDVTKGYPQYFNPDTGQSFPLCKYYRSFGHLYDASDAFPFSMNFSDDYYFNSMQDVKAFADFERRINKINEHQSQIYYDLL